MKTRTLLSVLPFMLLGALARAGEEPPQPPAKTSVPVRLQIVLARYHGGTKIASVPYTLTGFADSTPIVVRTGVQVPLRYEGKQIPGNVVYKSVGNDLECKTDSLDDGRFRVTCTIDESSLYDAGATDPSARSSLAPPVLRNFSVKASLPLRDGETAQYASATDPVSGEVVKIDVSLEVLK